MNAHAQTVEEIVHRPPYFHDGGNWALPPQCSRWIAEHVEPGWRTIETGCGSSTALLTVLGAHHTAVAPHEPEHEAIRAWCHERGVSTERLRSIVAHSQDALPTLDGEEFDLALIDGAHSFPIPMIDWYYLARRLRTGGFLLIDDLFLPAPRLLRNFLVSEAGRWRLECTVAGMACFRRTSAAPLIPADDWVGQPWSRPALTKRVRDRARIRTRLREVRRRHAR